VTVGGVVEGGSLELLVGETILEASAPNERLIGVATAAAHIVAVGGMRVSTAERIEIALGIVELVGDRNESLARGVPDNEVAESVLAAEAFGLVDSLQIHLAGTPKKSGVATSREIGN
jgi:hypothetical protein